MNFPPPSHPVGSIEAKRETKSYPAGRFLCFVGDNEKGSDKVHFELIALSTVTGTFTEHPANLFASRTF